MSNEISNTLRSKNSMIELPKKGRKDVPSYTPEKKYGGFGRLVTKFVLFFHSAEKKV